MKIVEQINQNVEQALIKTANSIAAEILDGIEWNVVYRLRGVSGYKKIKSSSERKAFRSLVKYIQNAKRDLKYE